MLGFLILFAARSRHS